MCVCVYIYIYIYIYKMDVSIMYLKRKSLIACCVCLLTALSFAIENILFLVWVVLCLGAIDIRCTAVQILRCFDDIKQTQEAYS